ncbi:MAG: hypothetical protein H6760_04475 [Candidatus Nomurabacteria bacterium]|nr:MAG: hypothetical protein H6760_04475 [Candidatus Nomurabacteria bacterium]
MPTRRTVPTRKRVSARTSKAKTSPSSVAEVKAPLQASAPTVNASKKLWVSVAGATLVIAVLWVALIGLNLSRTGGGDESLYDRIKSEVSRVFGTNSQAANTNNANLSDEELQDLEQRVFPSDAQDSGSFRTLPE